MPKSVEYGARNPKQNSASDKQEKVMVYGTRSVGDSFDKRASDVNATPTPQRYVAKGAKFDSKEPSFKKFR